jgi:hypothetical protein
MSHCTCTSHGRCAVCHVPVLAFAYIEDLSFPDATPVAPDACTLDDSCKWCSATDCHLRTEEAS